MPEAGLHVAFIGNLASEHCVGGLHGYIDGVVILTVTFAGCRSKPVPFIMLKAKARPTLARTF